MPVLEKNTDFKDPSPGMQLGILYRIIDLGTQEINFEGQISHKRQLLFQWELPEDLMDDGKPLSVGKFVKFSGGSKAVLTKITQASIGTVTSEGFDPIVLLGTACNLNITLKEKGDGVKIDSYAPLKKSEKAPAPYNNLVAFDLDKFDQKVFDSLSDGIKDIIKKSPEYMELFKPKQDYAKAKASSPPSPYVEDGLDDEIPF